MRSAEITNHGRYCAQESPANQMLIYFFPWLFDTIFMSSATTPPEFRIPLFIFEYNFHSLAENSSSSIDLVMINF